MFLTIVTYILHGTYYHNSYKNKLVKTAQSFPPRIALLM
uniref:Uncharacterized protein n=1 Tax=Arundo donax TaxID=35708 RepID=A0A0A9EXA0_ARUDO